MKPHYSSHIEQLRMVMVAEMVRGASLTTDQHLMG